MNIAIIDKAPSKNNYGNYFKFKFDLFHLSSVALPKILKKDIDIDIDINLYDLVILVGTEASKEYAKLGSVVDYMGQLIDGKFICIINPAMLIFKPEGKDAFNHAVEKINKYVAGEYVYDSATVEGDYKGIDNTLEAKEFLLEILNSDAVYVAMDTETTSLYPRDGYVLGISLSYKPRYGRYILSDILDEECVELLQRIANTKIVVFHNMKFDWKMIEYHFGIKFPEDRVHDTILMHYVLDENSSHGLKELAIKYTEFGDYSAELDTFITNYCKTHGIKKDDFTWDCIPFDIIAKYASIDPTVTLELANKFLPLIDKNPNFRRVYYEIMLPGTILFIRMEEAGIPMSKDRLLAADVYLEKAIEDARLKIYEFDEVKKFETNEGIIFNPNSVQQLRKLLFDYLGLTPTGKLTATGAVSTDAEVLEELSDEHPIPNAILKVRQLTKIRNTYISKILPELDKDSRIRTNFNLIFTTSGRASSSGKFNAQQIPRDDPIIKGCIVAPQGYNIVSQDLQTGEMYFAAVLSGDKNLQSVFKTGGDFHATIAKMVFDLPCAVEDVKELYPEMRQSAKAISFGILYGSGPQKVADTVSKATGKYYGIDRAREDIDAYFTKFKKLKAWLKSRKEFIEANGYTYSFFGRKRRLLNVFSTDKGIASHDVRSGINAEIQSLCSDINLLGAIDTSKAVKNAGLDANIFMLVHDSIVSLVKEEDTDAFCKILKEQTQKDRGCSIAGTPIGVDQDIGKDYSFGKFEKRYKLESGSLSNI